jgi:hypothetical protein
LKLIPISRCEELTKQKPKYLHRAAGCNQVLSVEKGTRGYHFKVKGMTDIREVSLHAYCECEGDLCEHIMGVVRNIAIQGSAQKDGLHVLHECSNKYHSYIFIDKDEKKFKVKLKLSCTCDFMGKKGEANNLICSHIISSFNCMVCKGFFERLLEEK